INKHKVIRWAVIAFVVGFYTTFVLQSLWNWFAVPALHVSSIGYWAMYGLVMLFGQIFDRSGDHVQEDATSKRVLILLDACVPDGRRADVQEALKQEANSMWVYLGTAVFGKVIGNTLTLGVGWAVRSLLL